ncbi:nuclear transport factor 2 family protein [Streptomyces caatingaensis]|uniref:SnoaL-like domain-containing protein n=1 Tax=Streptomyces caatingaensis TaxID=1678637 RepID=A0A0K9XKI2_9ACTN|nr:nuclear transport factor 2 family protein [Streptomyces caatingaensis]KNB53865.1 hypothetical protein AC230_04570 [Streptomyces caatingaensis]
MPRSPRDVLAAYHRAILALSADDLADLYAPDGVHEFPFLTPGRPDRYRGREEIRAGYRASWGARTPVRLQEIHDVAVFDGADPEIVVGLWRATARFAPDAAPITLSGLLILRVRDGLVVHAYDYLDFLGAFHASGRLPDLLGFLGAPAGGSG